MSRASMSPAELDLLCEQCGYVLNNLPLDGRCPECGASIAESSPDLRAPSAWERTQRPTWRGFLDTSLRVLFSPSSFFRSLAISVPDDRSRRFALIYNSVVSLLFGITAAAHLTWLQSFTGFPLALRWPGSILLAMLSFLTLVGVSILAARLTNWEATYRGLRMPLAVVRRGLRYHTAHYLPVALLTCAIAIGYQMLLRYGLTNTVHDLHYLYILSGAVILSSIYLFVTYWIGMKNLMYANR